VDLGLKRFTDCYCPFAPLSIVSFNQQPVTNSQCPTERACNLLQKCIIYILYRQIRNPLSLKLDDLMNWGEALGLKFLEKILT
jgi:hypothetical protein